MNGVFPLTILSWDTRMKMTGCRTNVFVPCMRCGQNQRSINEAKRNVNRSGLSYETNVT